MEDAMTKLIQLSMLLFTVLFSMPSNAMQVQVMTLDQKMHVITLDDSASIWSLKEKLFAKTRIPIDKQKLIAGNREATNNEKISAIPVDNRSPLRLIKMNDAPIAPQVVDKLGEARNNFNAHLKNRDYDMARMTAQSIIDSRRYTTPEKDEARTWLGKLPK